MSDPIDFEGINAAALGNGRALAQQLVPGGTFRSHEYVVRNPARDDKNLGSFAVNCRTGRWSDFAIGTKGGDFISWFAHARNVDQNEAARQIAKKLGIPLYKHKGANVGTPAKPNSSSRVISKLSEKHRSDTASQALSWERATDISHCGDEGPPLYHAEIRRHYYPSDGFPKQKVKIKRQSEPKDTWITWYRIFRNGIPTGWQPKKPDDYIATPYVTAILDPFDVELKADEILWPEGEKDVDSLNELNLPAFTFGGVGDGLPAGIRSYLKDRQIVILADNDDPGREHAEKKAALAHAAGAASVHIVHFQELPPKGDVSDFITNGGTAEQLADRIDRSPVWSPATLGKTSELVSLATIKPEATDWLWHHRIPRGACPNLTDCYQQQSGKLWKRPPETQALPTVYGGAVDHPAALSVCSTGARRVLLLTAKNLLFPATHAAGRPRLAAMPAVSCFSQFRWCRSDRARAGAWQYRCR
jgi:putative DNA primase/helicase